MIKEIYCKMPSDRGYKPQMESDSEIENILQQVKVILGTRPGQVLGSYYFGSNLSEFLFSYNNSYESIL